ncbi:MAG TPA: VWA domain-containing protein [Mycobacteriales bacterium]|nr:VWA domain-containing protein [Mycobacteriales bacterium]
MARSGYRYGAWHGGPDPLEPPFDVRRALDEIGDDVLAGASPSEALRRLLQQGTGDPRGLRGLDDLRRKVRQQARQARRRGRLDGTLEQVRELLDRAVAAERRELFPDPDDSARFAEAQLDALPNDPARAVRELSEYQWRSDEARQAYEEIKDLLRREVLDSQFRGMRDALRGATQEDMARIREMISALNDMLEADARGEHTQDQFDRFMEEYGEFFPENPADLAELVDTLARRAAAQQRLLDSLSDEQRQELADLMAGAMGDAGLAGELERLQQGLRAARPDLRWGGRERMDGDRPLGLGDATGALQEIADLEELDAMLDQDYPGASLDDIDPELVERALGRQAVDDVEALRRIERELQRQGYLNRSGGQLELTARAVRRLGATALRRVFSVLDSGGRGTHDVRDAGAAGEPTGSSRGWEYGDEQPLEVVRTVRNAVLRAGPGPVKLAVEDFEVIETERRTSATVALLVDLSYSMALRGTWGAAKSTALALHSLVTTAYPQDKIEIIGFSNYARVISPTELAGLSWDMVQGTNLQHALMLARRHLDRYRDGEPVIMVVTDGEPTAHLSRDGHPEFAWPPLPETLAVTLAEVERCTRRGATINVFMLDEEPALVRFVDELARRNGGRVFSPRPERLGEYVVSDYLRARRGRRSRRAG